MPEPFADSGTLFCRLGASRVLSTPTQDFTDSPYHFKDNLPPGCLLVPPYLLDINAAVFIPVPGRNGFTRCDTSNARADLVVPTASGPMTVIKVPDIS